MNLKTIKKDVSNTIFKAGEAFLKLNAVRELEEQALNQFIAFVDDGNDSFDVSITIDDKFEIIESACDCTSTDNFCSHKVAIALHLKDRGKSASNSVARKIKARKVDPTRQFIEDIPLDQLKQWIYDLTKTNKEFYQLLKVKFEKRIISLQWSEIETIHIEKIKAILKTAKYYDASQLQKILGLLTEYHQELIEEIFLKPNIDFKLLDQLILYLIQLNERARKKGERLDKYINSLKDVIQHRIDEADQVRLISSIEQYIEQLELENFVQYPFLKALLQKYLCTPTLIKVEIINKFINKINNKSLSEIKKILITALEKNNLLKDYIFKFKTEKYSSEMNALIIDGLINNDYLKEAERAAVDCIKNSFGFSYYDIRKLLIKIYELTDNPVKKMDQLEFTLMVDFNFEDYKFLEKNMKIEDFFEFKKRFNRILGQHKGQLVYGRFHINKHAEDQNWKGLLDLVEIDYPFYLYEQYFPQLLAYDRMGLLRKLCNMNHSYIRKMTKQDDEAWDRTVLENFTVDEVLSVVDAKSFYGFGIKEKVRKLYGLS